MAMQASKDIDYALAEYTKNGSLANTAGSGCMQDWSVHNLRQAVMFPYHATKREYDAVCAALGNRIVVRRVDSDDRVADVAHPHIKFLAEYMSKFVASVDFCGRRLKLLGPKFDKREVEMFSSADWVHYCVLNPAVLDKTRSISSTRALDRRLKLVEAKLTADRRMIEQAENQLAEAKVLSARMKVSDFMDRAEEIAQSSDRIFQLECERDDLVEEIQAVSGGDAAFSTEKVCACGAEKCAVQADVLVAFDSIYDMDIPKLLANADRCGVDEVFAVAIMPFGLVVQSEYYSDELDVWFRRTQKGGFLMVHGSDLSNGYVHSNETIFRMMDSCIVHAGRSVWKFEIVQNRAEMCLLRFTPASSVERVARKKYPSKFDRYVVMLDPLEYFAPWPSVRHVMVERSKLESAISFVKRYKKAETQLYADLDAHVTSMYARVAVGNTELQAGGVVSSEMVDIVVLSALIVGCVRKHDVNNAWQGAMRQLRASWAESAVIAVRQLIAEIMPGLVAFLTANRVQGFLDARIDLGAEIVEDEWADNSWLARAMGVNEKRLVELGASAAVDSGDELISTSLRDDGIDHKSWLAVGLHFAIAVFAWVVLTAFSVRTDVRRVQAVHVDVDRKETARSLEVVVQTVLDNVKESLDLVEDSVLSESGRSSSVGSVSSGSVGSGVSLEHDPAGMGHIEGRLSEATKAAKAVNQEYVRRLKQGVAGLSEKEVAVRMREFTREGLVVPPSMTGCEAKEHLEALKHVYFFEAATEAAKPFLALKLAMKSLLSEAIDGHFYERVPSRAVRVVNGYAGCGKTTDIISRFDPVTCAYIAPFADIMFDTRKKILKANPTVKDVRTRTYEKLGEIPRSGKVLFVDEAGSLPFGYLVLVLACFDYEEFVFMGDSEQTTHRDRIGVLTDKTFIDLVVPSAVERKMYTFRFGPSVALMLNEVFNYPVISLKSSDTVIELHHKDELNSAVKGTYITSTTDRVLPLLDLGLTATTAKSAQGRAFGRVNLVWERAELTAAFNYRSTGIVAVSRVQEELGIYMERYAKRTKAEASVMSFMTNYSALFGVEIPDVFEREEADGRPVDGEEFVDFH